MARTLEEILADLNNAEKEYAEKCKKYGIEEKHRKKKTEVQLDENGNPIEPESNENNNTDGEIDSNNIQDNQSGQNSEESEQGKEQQNINEG